MNAKYLSIIVGILGVISTLLAIWQNFRRRKRPNISIECWPDKEVQHLHPKIKLQNNGDSIRITRLTCCPADLISGLPTKYHDNWSSGETKTYILNNRYFPLKKGITIFIIVEDNNDYQFCISLSYVKKEMKIQRIMDYNFILKILIYLEGYIYQSLKV